MRWGLGRTASVAGAFALTIACTMSGRVAWAEYGDGHAPSLGSTWTQFECSPASPQDGQLVTCPLPDGFQYFLPLTLSFANQTTGKQQDTMNAQISYVGGQFQFTMPQLVSGDDYRVTATIKDGTTLPLGQFVAPVDPGHQLPETRYAILLPLVLVAAWLWRNRRAARSGLTGTQK